MLPTLHLCCKRECLPINTSLDLKMKTMINSRLTKCLDSNDLSRERQYGFRKSWSTSDLNTTLIERKISPNFLIFSNTEAVRARFDEFKNEFLILRVTVKILFIHLQTRASCVTGCLFISDQAVQSYKINTVLYSDTLNQELPKTSG